jgi:hypothetical protein
MHPHLVKTFLNHHDNQQMASSKVHRTGRIKRRHHLLVNSAILCGMHRCRGVLALALLRHQVNNNISNLQEQIDQLQQVGLTMKVILVVSLGPMAIRK